YQPPSPTPTWAESAARADTLTVDNIARVEIVRLGPGDADKGMAAGQLFDTRPKSSATERFLTEPGHHLLVAYQDGLPVGFITGVETVHPDKGAEMFLYEMGVDEAHR